MLVSATKRRCLDLPPSKTLSRESLQPRFEAVRLGRVPGGCIPGVAEHLRPLLIRSEHRSGLEPDS